MHNASFFLPPPPPPNFWKSTVNFFMHMQNAPLQPCKHIFTTENIPYRIVQIFQGCERKGVSSKQLHNFFSLSHVIVHGRLLEMAAVSAYWSWCWHKGLQEGCWQTHSSAILDKLLTSQAVQINVSIIYRNHILSCFFQLTAYVILPQRQHWHKYVGSRGTPDLFTTTVPLWGLQVTKLCVFLENGVHAN